MQQQDLQVRGIHGGVLITLPVLPWYQQRDLLVGRIQSQERFFKGGRIALDVGATDWNEEQLLKLLKALSDEGVCLWIVLSSSEITRQAAEYHGFPTSLPDPNKKKAEFQQEDLETSKGVSKFVCLARNLEEDEHYAHSGDLLVIGNVPEEARLEVCGSLILWGTLFGVAEVSVKPSESVRLLKIDGGRLLLNGVEVDISAKTRKNNGLVLTPNGNEVEITSLKPGRLL